MLEKKHRAYFNLNYESPNKNYDIYILFIENSFNILRNRGIVGFILPHKFFQSESGENIRQFIFQNQALLKIINFGTNQVFTAAATYTCLLFLQNKNRRFFFYKEFPLGSNFKNLTSTILEKIDINTLGQNKWNFNDPVVERILNKIRSQPDNFKSITKKIFKGSSTGNDKIFLMDLVKQKKNHSEVFSPALHQNLEIENCLLHPFIYGKDIRRYAIKSQPKVLLLPYDPSINFDLIPIDVLKTKYPKAFAYFHKLKSDLIKRKINVGGTNFYKYSAPRNMTEYLQPKIMIPDMLINNRISLDKNGIYFHGPAIHSVVFDNKVTTSPYFYLGILNSKLFWFFIINTSTALRGNAYRLTPEFLAPFCFPRVIASNQDACDKIINIVTQKLDGKLKSKNLDAQINDLVYKLYGLTNYEIKIVKNQQNGSNYISTNSE